MNANSLLAHQANIHLKSQNFDTGPANDSGEIELTKLWTALNSKPKFWLFGHFHTHNNTFIDNTNFIGLPSFKNPPLYIWDTKEKVMLKV